MSGKDVNNDRFNKRVQEVGVKDNSFEDSQNEETSSGQPKTTQSAQLKSETYYITEALEKCISEPTYRVKKIDNPCTDTSFIVQPQTYTESVTKFSMDQNNNSEFENVKESSEETTLDGRIILCSNETNICPEDCYCRCEQSLAGVEPLPNHYEVVDNHNKNRNQKPQSKQQKSYHKPSPKFSPANFKKIKRLSGKIKETGSSFGKKISKRNQISSNHMKKYIPEHIKYNDDNKQEHGYTDRYNYNHISITRGQSDPYKQPYLERLFGKKKKQKYKNMFSSSHFMHGNHGYDSGTTIPQLYKAKMKQLEGAVPERFTFKAVTGCAPYLDDYAVSKDHFATCSCKPECMYTSSPYTRRNMAAEDDLSSKTYDIEKTKKFTLSHSLEMPNPRACLNFDGNEYISSGELPERIDIYCFDHLNTGYFRTSDQPPPLITEVAMERTEALAIRFWAEIFGFVHILIAFIIAFVLQLYKCILYSFIRPLMIGLVQLTSDYFFKPFLTILYNGFTQPCLVFSFNVATSIRDVSLPIARGMGYFLTEMAVLLRAIRIIDLSKPTPQPSMKDFSC